MPNDEAEALRRRIAFYAERLREGVDAETAVDYLQFICQSEAELAKITGAAPRRSSVLQEVHEAPHVTRSLS